MMNPSVKTKHCSVGVGPSRTPPNGPAPVSRGISRHGVMGHLGINEEVEQTSVGEGDLTDVVKDFVAETPKDNAKTIDATTRAFSSTAEGAAPFKFVTSIINVGPVEKTTQCSSARNARKPVKRLTQPTNSLIFRPTTTKRHQTGPTRGDDRWKSDITRITTPVSYSKLDRFLVGYNKRRRQKLVSGIKFGFRIGFTARSRRKTIVYPNLKSAIANPVAVSKRVEKEKKLCRVIGPYKTIPAIQGAKVSPLGAVPKKAVPGKTERELRVIHHLSFPEGDSVNDGIPPENSSVKYATIDDVIDYATEHADEDLYAAKTDIEAAFRLLPVSPLDRHLLGFHCNGEYYMDTCLPFGCSSSCKIFEEFSTALEWITINKLLATKVVHVIDDFMFISATFNKCFADKTNFEALCEEIGVPLAQDKSAGPAKVIEFLGITVDLAKFETRIPEDKIQKGREGIMALLLKEKPALKELQSLIGFLNFLCRVVRPGRPFLRRLIDCTCAKFPPEKFRSRGYLRVRIPATTKDDLALWLTFLEKYNGRSFFIDSKFLSGDYLKLYTDSAKSIGYGGLFGPKWFYGTWPASWADFNITILELYPIYAALVVWGHEWQNKSICFFSDNSAVVHIINKQSSKDCKVMVLIRKLVLLCLDLNINFRAAHVEGRLNIYADKISRLQLKDFQAMAPWAEDVPHEIPQCALPSAIDMNGRSS